MSAPPSNIIDILTPNTPTSCNSSISKNDLNALLRDIISKRLSRGIRREIRDRLYYNIIDSIYNLFTANSSDMINKLKDLNRGLGNIVCDTIRFSDDDICVTNNNDRFLLNESSINSISIDSESDLIGLIVLKKYLDKAKEILENKIRNENNNDRKRKLKEISMVVNELGKIFVIDVNRYRKYINGLISLETANSNGSRINCSIIGSVAYVYLSLVNNYALFDDLEWFLVLVSTFARKSGGDAYLPVCPTTQHAIIAYYKTIRCDDDSFNFNVCNFLKSILKCDTTARS